MRSGYKSVFVAGAIALLSLVPACDFHPTAPFQGFDGMGSRVSGSFMSEGTSGSALTALPQTQFDDMTVHVKQDTSITDDVASNGSFTLVGLPNGAVTLVFTLEAEVIGRITLRDVLSNQEIRIVVMLTVTGQVSLVSEDRDGATLGSCGRGAGFWCQNQGGKNPNLSAEQFQEFAEDAAGRLSQIDALNTADRISAAVCDTSNQLFRQMATMALNLEAGLIDEGEGSALLDQAIQVALNDSASRQEQNEIKDLLEELNDCEEDDSFPGDDPPDDPPEDTECPLDSKGKITICHKDKNTITISPDAWPAHKAHGDKCGPCTTS